MSRIQCIQSGCSMYATVRFHRLHYKVYKMFSSFVERRFTSASLGMWMLNTIVQKTMTLKAVKEELNKIHVIELPGKPYPVKESFFIELETRQYSRWMAVLAQRLSRATAEKLLKTLKGSGGSGQSTQTAPQCPLTFLSVKQTLQRNRLLRLMLFSSIHDRGEVVAGPLNKNKYSHYMNCVASQTFVLVCSSHVHHNLYSQVGMST